MSNFWKNISRYPRFFISSLAGLILVILAPFRNQKKKKKFRFLFPIVSFLVILIFYKVILAMAGL